MSIPQTIASEPLTKSRCALILGGAMGVFEDAERAQALATFDGVIACNDVATAWSGNLTAMVSFHSEQIAKWLWQRDAAGYPPPDQVFVRKGIRPAILEPHRSNLKRFKPIETESRLPRQTASGSSGLFCVKVALYDLAFDRAVLCGIPMTEEGRNIARQTIKWGDAVHLRQGWKQAMPEIRHRVRSMSGWTQAELGAPTAAWVSGE